MIAPWRRATGDKDEYLSDHVEVDQHLLRGRTWWDPVTLDKEDDAQCDELVDMVRQLTDGKHDDMTSTIDHARVGAISAVCRTVLV